MCLHSLLVNYFTLYSTPISLQNHFLPKKLNIKLSKKNKKNTLFIMEKNMLHFTFRWEIIR